MAEQITETNDLFEVRDYDDRTAFCVADNSVFVHDDGSPSMSWPTVRKLGQWLIARADEQEKRKA